MTTYYMAPGGSNSAPGTSLGSPWKTFAYALPRLRPGDELVLLDGVYTKGASGFLNGSAGTYSSSVKSGTQLAPITVRARNERKAHIQGDGSDYPCRLKGISWWRLDGLRVSSSDRAGGSGGKQAGNVYVTHCQDVVVSRALSHHTNRYFNEHLYTASGCRRVLFEECEGYWGHRHGFSAWQSQEVVWTRCYVNTRNYARISGGYISNNDRGGGDEAFVQYRSAGGLAQNCIAVGSQQGFQVHGGPLDGSSGAGGCHNAFLGCIYIGNRVENGMKISSRTVDGKAYGAANNRVEHHLSLNSGRGLSVEATPGTMMRNLTIINTNGDAMQVRENGSYPGQMARLGNCSFTLRDSIIYGCDSYSLAIRDNHPTDVRYCSFYSTRMRSGFRYLGPNEDMADAAGNVRYCVSVKPTQLLLSDGYTPVWVPPGSNMATAGENGGAIGATILYRYEGGTLTAAPLWNPATGAFPAGAIVSGINDIAGASAFDVHAVLNVTPRLLPAGYKA